LRQLRGDQRTRLRVVEPSSLGPLSPVQPRWDAYARLSDPPLRIIWKTGEHHVAGWRR
jgi:hypothetical protein